MEYKETQPIRYTRISSPLGDIIIAAQAAKITHVFFADQKYDLSGTFVADSDPFLNSVALSLEEYFEGRRQSFDFELAPTGSPFYQAVWSHVQDVKFGCTATYGQIGASLGNKSKARAVGQAVGANPIVIIIPCHRIVGAAGLGGYSCGLWRKQYLLDLEQRG